MTKHCTRCRRRWSVSKYDTQQHYICPACARKERREKIVDKLGKAAGGIGPKKI